MMAAPRSVNPPLAGIALAWLLASTPVMAETDVIFSGTLVNDPCQVDATTLEQTVDFGPVASKTFIRNEHSTAVPFSVRLLECDVTLGSAVSVTFSGEVSSARPELFALQGTATGLGLAIEDREGNAILPDSKQHALALADGETTLHWQARLRQTGEPRIREGEFFAIVTFSLNYE